MGLHGVREALRNGFDFEVASSGALSLAELSARQLVMRISYSDHEECEIAS